MATSSMTRVLGRLRRAAFLREAVQLSDGELLERYVSGRDEAAFEGLVRRHGPMVLGVCRRVLQNVHDADDAFQATFLVLVRKAACVRPRESVGSWLYGVAYRAALKARAASARRRVKERQVREMPQPATVADGIWHDLEPLLDQELSRLPDKYRLPLVLCELEGKTRAQAARQLGWPEGTVAGRLARARGLLARRLTRLGLPCSAGMLTAVLSQNAASASVPLPLVLTTLTAAAQFAADKAPAGGVVSAPVAAITEGVLKAMLLSRLKLTAVVLMLALLTGGVGVLTRAALAAGESQTTGAANVEKEKPRETSGSNTITVKNMVLEKVDAAQQTLSVATPKQDTVAGTVLLDGGTVLLGELKRIGEVGVVEIMSDGTLRRKQAPAKPDTLQDKSKESQPARSAPSAPAAKTEGTKGKSQEPAKKAPAQADTNSGGEPQQPLGYYPPAQALVVKGTSRVHTTMGGDSLRVLIDSARSVQHKETKLEGLPVARDARIVIKGKPGKLADLRAGMGVTLELGADGGQVVVKSIKVEQ